MLSSSNTPPRDSRQFDLHARYTQLAEILTFVLTSGPDLRILDVGAGPERLTEEFLPAEFAAVTRTDVEAFEDEQLVAVASNAPLPFDAGAFDAVVAMDVLEHVRPAGREFFLRECLRVARTLTVIAAPIGCEAVRQAERDYASAFQRLFKTDEPFLVEHEAFGLPDPDEVRATLEAAGAAVVTVDNVRLADWLALNVVNLFLSTINDGDAVRAVAARMQNAAIPIACRGAQHYRRFFIATHHPALAERLAAQFSESALPQDERPELALLVLADELKRYVNRYHGPTLEAVLADREQSIRTLSEVVTAKDRHIEQLQAVADGLADQRRHDEAHIEQQAAALQSAREALRASEDALRASEDALRASEDALRASEEGQQASQVALQATGQELQQLREASLANRIRRVYRRLRGAGPAGQEARS